MSSESQEVNKTPGETQANDQIASDSKPATGLPGSGAGRAAAVAQSAVPASEIAGGQGPGSPGPGSPGPGSPGPGSLAAGTATMAASQTPEPRDKSGVYWIVGVALVFLVELFFYGRNGEIKVCVAKQGAHDFALLGQERTDENRWKFPFCEERTNIGLRSQFDEQGRDAVKVACRRATLMKFKDEIGACVASDKGWKRKVVTSQVWPWDRRFYRRLLWLDR